MEDNRKKLKVIFADERVDSSIIKYLETMFTVEILKNPKDLVKQKGIMPDLIIFSGGEDVTPELYKDRKGKYTSCNLDRDLIEQSTFNFFKQFASKIPKLGICRGAQYLTVLNGGKLIQHVNNHRNSNHTIEFKQGIVLNVPSDHHQMMYPYDLKPENYELIAYAQKYLSDIYLNGNNENIQLPDNFLEPEIIYYPKTNSLCIQPHPEWDINSNSSNYLLQLINNYLFEKERIIEENFDDYYEQEEPISFLEIKKKDLAEKLKEELQKK